MGTVDTFMIYYYSGSDHLKISHSICGFNFTERRQNVSSTVRISESSNCVYGNIELDSHEDSIVSRDDCCVIQMTGRECDVTP